jgi:LPS-assembly protein
VGRIAFQPNQIYTFSTRFRFDEETFSLQRLEVEASANFDCWNASILYGDYAAQPQLGFLARRDGILTSGAYKLNQNWVVNGGIRYDIENAKLNQSRFGLGYIDDCFMAAFQYYTDYTFAGSLTSSQTYMLQISLRTIGSAGFGFH